jgi:prepilin-type N-terminal cleavage/methylation domain-containing protein
MVTIRRNMISDGICYQSGFTLVELMISMSILALVTLIIGNGFRLGLDAWDKGEVETIYNQRLRVMSGMLSQQIKSAYPYKITDEEETFVIFKGEKDSLLFVTTLTDAASGGFKWVRYSIKDGTLLYKEGILPDKEFEDKITGDEEVVDTEIGEMELTYSESTEDDEWSETWDYGETLPLAVKVKIPALQSFSISIPMGIAAEDDESDKY